MVLQHRTSGPAPKRGAHPHLQAPTHLKNLSLNVLLLCFQLRGTVEMGLGVNRKSDLCSDMRSVFKKQNCHLGKAPMRVIDRE